MNNKHLPKNLSRLQYGDMKYIHQNAPTMQHLRKANMTTLTSLAYRGYLRKTGMGELARVVLTHDGEQALEAYDAATLNQRAREYELTERCLRLLQYSRRRNITELPKTA